MNLKKEDWLGSWINFERMIHSTEPAMVLAWREAEDMVMRLPPLSKMFGGSAKAFWEKTCVTITTENPVTVSGCTVSQASDGVYVEWMLADGTSAGRNRYRIESVLPKGLEGMTNYIFYAPDASENWPFRYIIAMEPLPKRSARENGGLMSHIHFQFASNLGQLVADGKLIHPMWYPTLCDGAGTLLDGCNIIRTMHKLPIWDALPSPAGQSENKIP